METTVTSNVVNLPVILKKYKEGTSLFSPNIGQCKLVKVKGNQIIVKQNDQLYIITENGKQIIENTESITPKEGEDFVLYPSETMKSWVSFKWKTNTVLTNKENSTNSILFVKWVDDTYTKFIGRCYLDSKIVQMVEESTSDWQYEVDKDIRRQYLKITVDSNLYNDEDIVYAKTDACAYIFYINTANKENIQMYAGIQTIQNGSCNILDASTLPKESIIVMHSASITQKKLLSKALNKAGYSFNLDTKELQMPKSEFKPYDKILGDKAGIWKLDFFSHKSESSFVGIADSYYEIIPFEGNENLIGKKASNPYKK